MRPVLYAALLLTALPAAADPALLTVAGQGTVSATPDTVAINTGVISTAKTAREALGANSQTMTALFETLKKLGVPDKAIRTTNLNLSPQYAPAPNGQMAFPGDRPVVGYRVNNNVNVTLDNPSRAGAVLDALVAAGANQAGGLSYTFRNDQGLLSQARTEAVKNAIERAHTYAAAAGITLGAIHAISDTGTISPFYGAAAPAMNFVPPPTPIGAGEQTLRANVTISWEIKP
jgi:uncharacterized protein YggE